MLEKEIMNLLKKDMEEIPSLKQDIALINQRLDYVQKDVAEIKLIVKELSDRPKEHWNTIVTAVITAVVTGFTSVLIFFKIKQ